MQDEDRPLVDRQAPEGALQLVAVGDDGRFVRGGRPVNGQDSDVGRPLTSPLRFVVAGMDEDPVEPGLEAVRFTQVRKPAPGEDQGVLQRVLGETRVAQDPMSDGVERVADLVHQDGERLTVALAGQLDEVSVHLGLR